MLISTIEALRQEKQANGELSSTLQSQIDNIAGRLANIRDAMNALVKNLEELAVTVKDELEVRDRAVDALIGE